MFACCKWFLRNTTSQLRSHIKARAFLLTVKEFPEHSDKLFTFRMRVKVGRTVFGNFFSVCMKEREDLQGVVHPPMGVSG